MNKHFFKKKKLHSGVCEFVVLHKYCRVDRVQQTIIPFKHYVSTHRWDQKHIYAASHLNGQYELSIHVFLR